MEKLSRQNDSEKLTPKNIPIFLVFLAVTISTSVYITLLFWLSLFKKMSLGEIGYHHIIIAIFGVSFLIFSMVEYRFLRPTIVENKPTIIILTVINWIVGLAALMLFCSLMIHFVLMEGPLKIIIKEVFWLITTSCYISIVNYFIIPILRRKCV